MHNCHSFDDASHSLEEELVLGFIGNKLSIQHDGRSRAGC